jgi:2-C-methyl-D-erythritol 4-phosphate cytidylyltransferase
MDKYAIIVAAGKGSRIGGDLPKQFQLLKGKPVLWYSVKAFLTAYDDIHIILVLPGDNIEKGELLAKEFPAHDIHITKGGETRYHSVQNGLQFVKGDSVVFVHDGVRCLVTPELIRHCGDAAIKNGNAIPAIKASDSLRLTNANGNNVVDRNEIKVIQTPQVFLSNIILPAFSQPWQASFTDEASVVEKNGTAVNLIEGEETNIKITRPVDFRIAEAILEERDA